MSDSPVAVMRPVIHHASALRVVRAALVKAEQLEIEVCIAVVDSSGRLVCFCGMPSAFLISTQLAQDKARAVASLGVSIEDIEILLANEAPRVRDGLVQLGVTTIRGGLPLRHDNAVIGAIGVSGGSEAQDVQCAEAGAAALHF